MTEIDMKTALSVFSKFPIEKIRVALDSSVQLATDKMGEADLPPFLAKNHFNALEVQLGTLAAHHHAIFLKDLGTEHIPTIVNFVKILQQKTVGEKKIASALRGAGLKEEQIRACLALMGLWSPGKILPDTAGRGHDDFSLKMRELFSLYLEGFLVRETIGRLTLVRMVLEPEKDKALRLLLREMGRLDLAVQNAKPFWWAAEHEKMLHETLLRRIPQLVLGPLTEMADQWSELPPEDELKTLLSDNKLPPYLGTLFQFMVEGSTLAPSEVDWTALPRETLVERIRDVYRELASYTVFFYFESKGGTGWKRHYEASEKLTQHLNLLFVQEGKVASDGFSAENREILLHALALNATLPVPAASRLVKELHLDSAANIAPVAKIFRQFIVLLRAPSP